MIDAKKVNEQEQRILLSFIQRGVRSNIIYIDGYPLFTFFISLIRSDWDYTTYNKITYVILSIVQCNYVVFLVYQRSLLSNC